MLCCKGTETYNGKASFNFLKTLQTWRLMFTEEEEVKEATTVAELTTERGKKLVKEFSGQVSCTLEKPIQLKL